MNELEHLYKDDSNRVNPFKRRQNSAVKVATRVCHRLNGLHSPRGLPGGQMQCIVVTYRYFVNTNLVHCDREHVEKRLLLKLWNVFFFPRTMFETRNLLKERKKSIWHPFHYLRNNEEEHATGFPYLPSCRSAGGRWRRTPSPWSPGNGRREWTNWLLVKHIGWKV